MIENVNDLIEGFVDTEQTITRSIRIRPVPELDMKAHFRQHNMRPNLLSVTYRVNRGGSTPFWYAFDIRVYGQRVLKSGETSASRANRAKNSYHRNSPAPIPGWVEKLVNDRLPTVPTEV